ncbi:1-aminocyclopropane-1-carboxylate deaminase [Catenulispora acidiphila DSM 44928]|uniref:1-aminocyclopropane-1-carboxylate deaminase n=1 Tax=Catenulispora acidiphila (strain DSM 44928 / JCM 14897 / NBRC 102108 / NRRL B-24433 / ID139908) TaxID=479433 RepID=C7QGK4_CATAD|nr:pyridoxal-phosphate dependent enzyme [Catenulispora acidiphila]ACU74884.1 1-aminocyclopropane-1-carboxylate deaminase [Catenulispora acidiphila DSM 44928]
MTDLILHFDNNKPRKLKYNLAEAHKAGATTLLTFGGAYSNHIRAVAAAGRTEGFATIGVIRGEEHLPLNESLAYAASQGMHLTYMDRESYRTKNSPTTRRALHNTFGDFFLIPEGGSNPAAVRGCAELPAEIPHPFDIICCPVGTGGTLAGISAGLSPTQRAIGFAALKGDFLKKEVADLQRQTYGHALTNWHIETDYHFGGYAKIPPHLEAFAAAFGTTHGFEVDRIYVAKMLYGITHMIEANAFAPTTRIVAVITTG